MEIFITKQNASFESAVATSTHLFVPAHPLGFGRMLIFFGIWSNPNSRTWNNPVQGIILIQTYETIDTIGDVTKIRHLNCRWQGGGVVSRTDFSQFHAYAR